MPKKKKNVAEAAESPAPDSAASLPPQPDGVTPVSKVSRKRKIAVETPAEDMPQPVRKTRTPKTAAAGDSVASESINPEAPAEAAPKPARKPRASRAKSATVAVADVTTDTVEVVQTEAVLADVSDIKADIKADIEVANIHDAPVNDAQLQDMNVVDPVVGTETATYTPDSATTTDPSADNADTVELALEPVSESIAPKPSKPRKARTTSDAVSQPSRPARPSRSKKALAEADLVSSAAVEIDQTETVLAESAHLDVLETVAAETAVPETAVPETVSVSDEVLPVVDSSEHKAEPAVQPAQPSYFETALEALALEPVVVAPKIADNRDPHTILGDFFRKHRKPWHVRDLERALPRSERAALGERRDIEGFLEEMSEAGILVRTRRRTYGLIEAMNLIKGRFQGSSSGFGFGVPEDGSEDYYISPENTQEAWNGDTVLIRPEGKRGNEASPRGTVVRIVQRAYQTLVGTLEFSKGYAILHPDDPKVPHRVLLLPNNTEGLRSGARVVVRLFWPEDTGEDEVYGEISEVLGLEDTPEVETRAVVLKYHLSEQFSEEAIRQAESIPLEIPESALVGRLDLRDQRVFTIDGRDAKDFDDAIHIEDREDGFLLGIHIADVSHYVSEGSALDRDAYDRATSVYLPGHVLPMLPERLSNGICSLVPYQDRLTLSALVDVSAEGEIRSFNLAPSVIRSKARLTYDEVQAYSEGNARIPEHGREVEGDLHVLLKLTSKMRQRRLREGSLDFHLREVKVEVEKDGTLTLIPIREETARGLIEDLMLLANKVVARYLIEHNIPSLFRVHEDPALDRFNEVGKALARMGLIFSGTEPTPQVYQNMLKQARNTPAETVVNQLLLRSLKQARYASENLGHFGLAFEEYLHFTSPIRRYPDLLVHRGLRGHWEKTLHRDTLAARMPEMASHTSERERNASEAERDLSKYYQAKWAQTHLGEAFTGTVNGVTSFGVFINLENGVEGLLHISNLDDDYYIFVEEALQLRGRSKGKTYRLGDHVTVQIAQVNPLARQIDFALQENDTMDSKPRTRRRGDEGKAQAKPAPTVAAAAQAQPTKTVDARTAVKHEHARPQAALAKRRIVTLERSRNEHNRPVNAHVSRVYFGDWNASMMPEDDGQPQQRSSRGGQGGRYPARGGSGNNQPQNRGPKPVAAAAVTATPTDSPVVAAGVVESAEAADKRRRRRRRRRKPEGGSSES